jgi:hypothetical protein
MLRGEVKKKVVLLLNRDYNYQQVADRTGLTYRQVRSIAEREGLTKKRKVYELSEQVRKNLLGIAYEALKEEVITPNSLKPRGEKVRVDIDLTTEMVAKIDFLKNIFSESSTRYSRGDVIEILLRSGLNVD